MLRSREVYQRHQRSSSHKTAGSCSTFYPAVAVVVVVVVSEVFVACPKRIVCWS